MDDFADARRRREEDLRLVVVASVLEHLVNAASFLQGLITSEEAFEAPLDRLAQRVTADVVERTRYAHPLEPSETAVVVHTLTSVMLRVFVGTFRGAAAKSKE